MLLTNTVQMFSDFMFLFMGDYERQLHGARAVLRAVRDLWTEFGLCRIR